MCKKVLPTAVHTLIIQYLRCFTKLQFFLTADGNWGPWQGWSQCSEECGIMGNQSRVRSCDSPSPILNGTDCIGYDNETRDCVDVCPTGKYSRYQLVFSIPNLTFLFFRLPRCKYVDFRNFQNATLPYISTIELHF